ncbi:GNAT family N-acetyltransferase [Massilia horti]|uniref:GNAT family N-acetyltransferase n=1 Tax=Massilia horti TaxID=2562153 RepID=A0A4Y9SU21_9BURK|nr:GNAT family N-acetyltransferase [Massilia horti]TFW30302.1 GNAT family N-acetyltransferase [Massilia horti]
MSKKVTIRRVGADEAPACIERLADVLIDSVEGGASVSFMLPMPREKAVSFWRGVADGVARGERTLLVAEDDEGEIVGTVQMVTAMPENQPHRADIAKLLVHRRARRAGVGQLLMATVEDAAREQGKSVLVLDTASADAERLYERLGWTRVGEVPQYALLPDGKLSGTTFFYKHV